MSAHGRIACGGVLPVRQGSADSFIGLAVDNAATAFLTAVRPARAQRPASTPAGPYWTLLGRPVPPSSTGRGELVYAAKVVDESGPDQVSSRARWLSCSDRGSSSRQSDAEPTLIPHHVCGYEELRHLTRCQRVRRPRRHDPHRLRAVGGLNDKGAIEVLVAGGPTLVP